MKMSTNLIYLIVIAVFLASCAFSSVGGGTYKEDGKEKKAFDECMGHCLSKTEDGKHCTEFTEDMAKICKDYLYNR